MRASRRRLVPTRLFYTDDELLAFGNYHRIEVIMLAPSMQRIAETKDVLLHGSLNSAFGYWNDQGHHVAGSLIAEKLCAGVASRP